MSKLTERAIAEAERLKASYILVNLNTYGGTVDDGDKIRTALLRTKIPTIVYIQNNAASAGALISIACDSIYMTPGSTIGAASVVNQNGDLMPEKYQSYMRKKMRATAEETGRNPLIAEGMTDENLEIDSVKAKGKIVTFSTKEAIKYGYCNGQVESVEEILPKLSGGTYTLVEHESSWTEALMLWLISPAVSGLLLLVIFGGIYMEFKTPGTFVFIGISAVAALLYLVVIHKLEYFLNARIVGGEIQARAWELLRLINPVSHGNAATIAQYKVEPYVVSADVYGVAPHAGRGGWSWYTGAAGWLHRAAVESILGLHLQAHELWFTPCLPLHWPRAEITLEREGRHLRCVLLRADVATAQAACPGLGARLLRVGERLCWADLPPDSVFVIPLD